MRVIEVVHGFPPDCRGGTESYVERLSLGLLERGIEVLVVSGALESRSPAQTSEARWRGIRVLRIHRPDAYYESWERSFSAPASELFEALLDRERPDLVHVHHWLRLSRDLVRRAEGRRVPALLTLHDFAATCLICFRVKADDSFCLERLAPEVCLPCVGVPAGRTREEALAEIGRLRADLLAELDRARRRFALSRSHAELLARVTGRPPSHFEVLPFRAVTRLGRAPHQPRPAGAPLRLVNWGYQFHLKGQHLLLEAVRRARHRSGIRVDLLGTPVFSAYDEKLRSLAEGLDVGFHGPYEFSALERRDADLAVFPMLSAETYGFVLDEAKQLGLPAAVPDLGALRERVGEGGFVLPRGDVGALAALLDELYEDPPRLEGVRARVGEPEGSFDDHLDALLAAYREVCGER